MEEARSKRKSRDSKRAISFHNGSSNSWLDIKNKPRLKKTVSNQFPAKFPKPLCDSVSNPNPQKGRGTSSPTKKPTCGKCGKKHYGDCLRGKDNCFGCGKSGNKV